MELRYENGVPGVGRAGQAGGNAGTPRQDRARDRFAERIIELCGLGSALDAGATDVTVVQALLRNGMDARGLCVSPIAGAACADELPERFTSGGLTRMPYDDETFDTVLLLNSLERLTPEEVEQALREVHRVCRRNVLVRVRIVRTEDEGAGRIREPRSWWERRCLEAGFRKHAAYYRLNDYEALNRDGEEILILLARIPPAVRDTYPLQVLEAERGLHMDMLRDVGERSDAHVVRYHWAARYVKRGDRVLDAACGLGYGSHVLRRLTPAATVMGIDGSSSSIEYATTLYGEAGGRTAFRCGFLPDALADYADASFDLIVSFETLEHVEDPTGLLAAFHRVLAPGGRVVVSVPNDWSDETGRDPNPYHLHVYDRQRLQAELGASFILEHAFAQTASRCKVSAKGNVWEPRQRALQQVNIADAGTVDCEWWLMTAMKPPQVATQHYREGVFGNVLASGHPAVQYAAAFDTPWLMHAMVNAEYRVQDPAVLDALALEVLGGVRPGSSDHAAALCVHAYRVLDNGDRTGRQATLAAIDRFLACAEDGAMALRWRVSLLFVKACLQEAGGELKQAQRTYEACSRMDVSPFGIHLATKTTEAAYRAGRIACALGAPDEARNLWQQGVALGEQLLRTRLDAILINAAYPNLFNHGDGVREYCVAWDNIARCANGLHLLQEDELIDYARLNNCFQTEYRGVTGDLIAEREELARRTAVLELAARELVERTQELVENREALRERTERLEALSCDPRLSPAQDDGQVRRPLALLAGVLGLATHPRDDAASRMTVLDRLRHARRLRTIGLAETHARLAERNVQVSGLGQDLVARTEELVDTRAVLVERTERLERVMRELELRTDELVALRAELLERTQVLERVARELDDRTEELVATRAVLKERTERLEAVAGAAQRQAPANDRDPCAGGG